ncbi:hypothetical protein BJX64DRAFT_291907 [Aspergillus heterothallicus]
MPAPARKLGELPAEVLELVTKEMDIETILSFRSSSRYAAQCSHWHFNRNYRNTIVTDFSRQDFDRIERRLKDEPNCISYVGTLAVTGKPADTTRPLQTQSLKMGAGFKWERAWDYGLLDLTHENVTAWRNLLSRFTNLQHFRINTDLDLTAGIRWDLGSDSQLSYSDVWLIAMPLIKEGPFAVTSLDLFGPNFYRGFMGSGQTITDDDERPILDALFPASGPKADWPHLESITLRFGMAPTYTRFKTVISHAPKLKKVSLLGILGRPHLADIASCADVFKLEELHLAGMGFDPISENDLRRALRAVRGTLKTLSLAEVSVADWVDLLRFLRDTGFPALREFTIDKVAKEWNISELHWPLHAANKRLITAPSGGKVTCKLSVFNGATYCHMVTYSGTGMNSVLEQLAANAVLIHGNGAQVVAEETYTF